MNSAVIVARTGGWLFALGIGLAVATAGAGTAAADADASPKSGASAANSAGSHSPRAAAKPVSAKRGGIAVTSTLSARTSAIRSGRGVSARTVAKPAAPLTPEPGYGQVLTDVLGAGQGDLESGQMYGNPTLNSKYWVAQSSMNCVLMATAMAIGQLTGKTPTESQIVYEALNTPSVYEPGKAMYLGLKSNIGVANVDAFKLLENHGISTTVRDYPDQPELALENMKTALANPNQAVMATVDAFYIWDRLQDKPPRELANFTNHMVVVVGFDSTTNTVYLNDSGMSSINPATDKPWGQNMAVPLDVFTPAWSVGKYYTVVAQVTGEAKPIGPWVNLMPRRDLLEATVSSTLKLAELLRTDPDYAAHVLHYR